MLTPLLNDIRGLVRLVLALEKYNLNLPHQTKAAIVLIDAAIKLAKDIEKHLPPTKGVTHV